MIIAACVWLLYGQLSNKNQKPQYQTAQVERGKLVVSLAESGQVVASNRVAITTEASGVIKTVYVSDGESVTAGQKIADLTLDTDGAARQAQSYASYLSAQNNLNSAQAKLYSLQSSLFEANQDFVGGKGTTNPIVDDPDYVQQRADWLQAEADYKNQANVIAQAQAALNSARLTYQSTSPTIVAPAAGEITDVVITPGLLIKTTAGTNNTVSSQQVASIRTEGNPIVSVALSEIDITKIKLGQKASVTLDALPDQIFTGVIAGIDKTGVVSSGVTNYPATIVIDTPTDELLPNMSATANVITDVRDNVLLVPIGAVQTSQNRTTVRVLRNGQVREVPVEVGESSETETEITSGLKGGETVVTAIINSASSKADTSASPFRLNTFGGGTGGGGNNPRSNSGR